MHTLFNFFKLLVEFDAPTAGPAGSSDAYEVYTHVGEFPDVVKNPLNGCSAPSLMQLNSSVTVEVDGDSRSFTVHNPHQRDDDPSFTIVVRVVRTFADKTQVADIYPALTVGDAVNISISFFFF